MKLQEFKVTKTIKNDLVGEVKRKANVKIALPENLEEAEALFGDALYKWARHGYLAHAKITAAASLLGALGDKKSIKLVRQFGEGVRTLTEIMGMERPIAIAKILENDKFATLREAVKQQTEGNFEKLLDYTNEASPLKEPEWFSDESKENEDDDENDDNDEAKAA